jgi:hypothetical protein
MAERKLRIIKTSPSLLGVCERCNSQFTANTEVEIHSDFDAHKCTLRDGSQNALRIVREATENK